MTILSLLAFAGAHIQAPTPVLWLRTDGEILIEGQSVKPRFTPGATTARVNGDVVYDFNGTHGGILFPDLPELALTDSITISVWVDLRSYVDAGPGAQILFRGDDRCGVDPYTLCIHPDGTACFGIQDANDHGWGIGGEVPLGKWTCIVANFNANTGEMELWLNGDRVAYARTSHRPFDFLDKAYAPGVGIGNVQNDHGPHNQPLNGMIADLRLYRGCFTPAELDPQPTPGTAIR